MSKKSLSIGQNIAWNMIGSAIGLGCQWAISIAVVRLSHNLSDAGIYSLAMSVFGIFSPVANFGMYTYLITDQDDKSNVGEFFTLVSFTTLIALLGTTVYTITTCSLNTWVVVIAYSLYKSIATIIDILHAADQKAHRMDYIGISLALQGVFCLIAFCIIFLLTKSLLAAVLSMAIATLLIGLLYDIPKTRSLFTVKLGITKERAITIIKVCVLIVISSMANGAFASIPRQAISTLLGDEALGIYASIATPVAIIQVGSTYIYNPLIGYFAESYYARDVQKFKTLLNKTLFGIMIISVVSIPGTLLFGKPLLGLLYGKQVALHSNLMIGLTLSSILLGLSGFLSNLLVAVRAPRTMVAGSLTALIIVIVSNSSLITTYGMNGATAALALGCLGAISINSAGIAKKIKHQQDLNN